MKKIASRIFSSECKKVKTGHTYLQWAIALIGSSIILQYGFQVGWVSPMKGVLQSEESPTGAALSDIELSFVATSSTLAAIIGAPVCLYLAEVYGRKIGAIATISFYTISWLLKVLATHTEVLMVARVCGGFGVGGTFVVIPMYVREISQDSIRGTLVSLTLSFHHLGVLAMYAMGTYLPYYTTLYIALSISILSLLLMLFAPESPEFLVKKGKVDDAAKSMANLRGLEVNDAIVKNEIDHLKKEHDFYESQEKITYATIFKNKAWRRGFFLSLILVFCVEFHGCFAIVTYALGIMAHAVSVEPELQSFIVPILLLCGSFVPILFIERAGRKPLIIVAYVVSALSLGCLASVLLVQQRGVEVPSWVPGLTIAVTVFAYSAGVLPVTSVILNDMFKFQVRGKLLSLIHVVNWLSASVQVFAFVPITNTLGMSTVFYTSMVFNVLCALIVLMFVPETKGRTVEEIDGILLGKKLEKTSEDASTVQC